MNRIDIRGKLVLSLFLIFGIIYVPSLIAESITVPDATGYGQSKRIALRDAFRDAIERGLGVEIIAKTEVERFRLVKDHIFTQSTGYVESYEIVSENPKTPMGHEVVISAVVTKGKISKLSNLKMMIDLMGNPSIMVKVYPAVGGYVEDVELVQHEIVQSLENAGYNMISTPTGYRGDLENALDLAADAGADVLILGKVHSVITGRAGSPQFPLITSSSTFTGKVIVVETGEIVYSYKSSEGKGTANTEESSIKKAITSYSKEITDDLLWNMAPKIGPPYNIELSVAGIDCGAVSKVADYLTTTGEIENITLKNCKQNVAKYKTKVACSSTEFINVLKRKYGTTLEVTEISHGSVSVRFRK